MMSIGTRRSPEKVMFLWVITFGIYGIYWISKTLQEIKAARQKGIGGATYATTAVVCPPLALTACWYLPAATGKLYTENGKFEQINSCWGAMLFLPTVVIWLVASMATVIISKAGGDVSYMYMTGAVTLLINIFLLYNWLKKIQHQLNDFWAEAETGNIKPI